MNAEQLKPSGMSADEPVPGLYIEETVCPFPEREVCEGCPKYIEDEGICELEY